MSGELIMGLWLTFCAGAGAWRALREHRHQPERALWLVETVLALFTGAAGVMLVALALARNALSPH